MLKKILKEKKKPSKRSREYLEQISNEVMISGLLIKLIKVYQKFLSPLWDKTVDFIQRVLNMQWKLCRFTVSLGGDIYP